MKARVRIRRDGGPVDGAVIFGFASVGRYWLWVYDAEDKNPTLLGEGASDDDLPDVIRLPDPPSLLGKLALLRAKAALPSDVSGTVGVTLRLTQGGQSLPGGELKISANIDPGQEATFSFAVRFDHA